MTSPSLPALPDDGRTRRLLGTEVVLVVALAVGVSSARSVLRFLGALAAPEPLPQQRVALNTSLAPDQPWLDLGLQLVVVAALLLPALLALHLLARTGGTLRDLGLRRDRLGRDALLGVATAAAVGGIGLAGYLTARALGASLTLVPTALPDVWWRLGVLVLSACANSVLEEVVLVGYLGVRTRQLGWSAPAYVATSGLLRASYHLYQGLSGFLGNLAMGVVFAAWFRRTGRLVPLVVAHAVIDIVAFVGYLYVAPRVDWL